MANLPLHGHHCPRWLFDRMVRLSTAIVEVIVEEYGPEEILKRMSDPNRNDYDRSIELLERALRRVKSGRMEVVSALKRLSGIQKHIEKNNGNSGIIRQP